MHWATTTLSVWRRCATWPGGKWAFARLLCLKAPYFGSIRPQVLELRPGYCAVRIRKRRAVLNHLGTVHAIAMCNMAELAAGAMTQVSVPATQRWIPKGMTVEYLQKATTDLVAVATPASELDGATSGDYTVKVVVSDLQSQPVFRASITMWLAPRPAA